MERSKASRAPQFEEETFFEYHLYTLDRPTTIKDNQTKQLNLMQAAGVPADQEVAAGRPSLVVSQPVRHADPEREGRRDPRVRQHASEAGLGIPLPKGTVRVYKKDRSGSEQFVGEDAIDHTPRDETISLRVGDAFDVVADRTQTDYRKLSPRQAEIAFEISIRNRKDDDVTVTVREPMGGDWKLLESNHPGQEEGRRHAGVRRRRPGAPGVQADLPGPGDLVALDDPDSPPGQPRVGCVVFDFDGTLAPDSTTGFLRDRGVDVDAFWRGVENRVGEGWDPVPAYFYGVWELARTAPGVGGIDSRRLPRVRWPDELLPRRGGAVRPVA